MKKLIFTLFVLSVAATGFASPPETRMLKDAEGTEVSLPLMPERVVVLSEIDLDIALALGLKPVGAVNGRGQKSLPHYLKTSEAAPLTESIKIVGDIGRPEIESIIRLKPDLILTSSLRPEVLALLRKVAPTFVSYKNEESWKVVFARVAKALGREGKAADFLAGYEKELKAAKAKLSVIPGKTVSIVRWNPGGPAFMYEDSFASLVLRDMGFERPASQKVPGVRHSMPLSFEALQQIDASWLFVGTLDPKGEAVKLAQDAVKNPAFQRLSAVKAKRYFPVDGSKWTSIGGPLAALSIVKETAEMMTSQNN